tara:strand:- start:2146 stop:3093 length:948 start_codon:yes stop_codon:yes gene_type:complete
MQNNLAPVCLFTYNRLEETKQTIEALQNNFLASDSKLFIFSDGPKNEDSMNKVEAVRNYIHSITGFKNVHVLESKKNKGLANSIIEGVTKIINEYGCAIVLEDDLITSPNFLDFMNKGLQFYYDDDRIQSINGFSLDLGNYSDRYDTFSHMRTYSWGWATWGNRWSTHIFNKKAIKNMITPELLRDFNVECGSNMTQMLMRSLTNSNDSWYASWAFYHFIENKHSIYPYLSKIENIGYGVNATHCSTINVLKSNFDYVESRYFKFKIELDDSKQLSENFLKYFTLKYKILFRINLIFKKGGIKLLVADLKGKLIN